MKNVIVYFKTVVEMFESVIHLVYN